MNYGTRLLRPRTTPESEEIFRIRDTDYAIENNIDNETHNDNENNPGAESHENAIPRIPKRAIGDRKNNARNNAVSRCTCALK